MKKFTITLCLALLLVLPQGAQAETIPAETYRSYLLEVIALLQQQISALQAERSRLPVFTSFLISDKNDVVARYALTTPEAATGITNVSHRRLTERLLAVTPDLFDSYIKEIVIFDGDYEFDAFVETIPPYQDDTWRFGTYADILEFPLQSDETTALLVHEVAHIISYDDVPGENEVTSTVCHAYFAATDCPPKASYLNVFIDEFWTDTMLNTLKQRGTLSSRYSAAAQAELFVSEYAATAPGEDFAESFAVFVLEDMPTGTALKDEKVRMLYTYPELVSWRNEIRAALE